MWRNDVNAAVGVVGIMINKWASTVLSEVIKWNERRGKNYDWSVLKNKEIKDNYIIELKNRFESLRIENETSTETYENLIQANKETTKELILKKSKTKQMNIANDQRVINARKNASNSVKLYFEDPNETNSLKLQEDKKALTDAYDSV